MILRIFTVGVVLAMIGNLAAEKLVNDIGCALLFPAMVWCWVADVLLPKFRR